MYKRNVTPMRAPLAQASEAKSSIFLPRGPFTRLHKLVRFTILRGLFTGFHLFYSIIWGRVLIPSICRVSLLSIPMQS